MHNVNEQNDSCPVQSESAAASKNNSCWNLLAGFSDVVKAVNLERLSQNNLIFQVLHL